MLTHLSSHLSLKCCGLVKIIPVIRLINFFLIQENLIKFRRQGVCMKFRERLPDKLGGLETLIIKGHLIC